MTNFVKNVGVLIEMDPHSCIFVRIRSVFLKLLGIQKTVSIQRLTRGSRLNCPPISKMFKTIQFAFYLPKKHFSPPSHLFPPFTPLHLRGLWLFSVSLLLRSLRFRTKQVIKVMRAKDKGDKKNRFR